MAKRAKLTLTDAEEPKKAKARKATVKKASAQKSTTNKTTVRSKTTVRKSASQKTIAKRTDAKAATSKRTAKKAAPKKTTTKQTAAKPPPTAKAKPDHGVSSPQPHQNRRRSRTGSPSLSKQAALGLGVLAVLAAGIFLFAKSRT